MVLSDSLTITHSTANMEGPVDPESIYMRQNCIGRSSPRPETEASVLIEALLPCRWR